MRELPRGWGLATLSDVASWGSGGTPKATRPAYYGGSIPWAVIGDLSDAVVSDTASRITEKGLAESSAKLVAQGSILIAMYGSIGKLGIAGAPMATNQAIAFANPYPFVMDGRYLFYYLRSQRHRLNGEGKGATQQNISQTILKAWPVPVAPLAEQRHIVSAIEEQFSLLDAGVAALERVRQSLKRMRASVLQHAATEFEVRLRTGADEPVGQSPTAWPRRMVREIATLVVDGDHNPPKRAVAGVPHLTARNVKRGQLIVEGCSFVSEDDFERTRRRYSPQPGDLIVTCVGTLGETAIVPNGLTFSADRNLAAIRPAASISSEFLKIVLDAPAWQRRMQVASGSTAQPHLYLNDLRALEVPVPPLSEQMRIVEATHGALSHITNLVAALDDLFRRHQVLRSSILSAAFSGKLVLQDPTDEPASVLLERIAAERVASNGHKPSRAARQERLPV